MRRGARFLASGRCTPEGCYRAKVIGNGLRELDRFLNILIGEVARSCGVILPHRHNSANQLRSLRAAMALDDHDHARLSAFGRTRECLFHCGGSVRRGDARGGAALTTGWLESSGLRRVVVGSALVVSAADIAEACDYYEDLATRLLAEAALYLADRLDGAPAHGSCARPGRSELGEGPWFAA